MPAAAELASAAADRLTLVADIAVGLDEKRGEEDATSEAVARATGDLRDAARALRQAFDSGEDAVAAFEGLAPPFDRWRLALRQVAPAQTFHDDFLSKLESFACVYTSRVSNFRLYSPVWYFRSPRDRMAHELRR